LHYDTFDYCTLIKDIVMPRGGKRAGAGRKNPVSPFGEKTSLIRVPQSIEPTLVVYLNDYKKSVQMESEKPSLEYMVAMLNPPDLYRPIYSGKVSAGLSKFASPAQDYEQEELNLNKHLVKNPPATFYYNVGADYDSMIDVGILPKALLIVDKSINPRSSHIVLAVVNGENVVKRLYKWRNVIELRSENKEMNYPSIVFNEGDELIIKGVVTANVNKHS
jgi:DNA polymerase V